MKASWKICAMSFIKYLGIRHQVESLRILYSVNLTYIFKVKHLNVNIPETARISTKMGHLPMLIFVIEWRLCTYLYSENLFLHFQDQKCETLMYRKRRELALKMRAITFRDIDIRRRMTSINVILLT